MHHPMARFLLCVGFASMVHGQTLQLVSPIQTGSVTALASDTPLSISELGVGADGMTTYVEVGAETLAVEISGTVTRTLLSTPLSFTATFVEDASRWRIGTTGRGLFESCTFGADGNGACVNEFVDSGGASTLTSTYSGPVLPWYTLNAAASPRHIPDSGVEHDGPSMPSNAAAETQKGWDIWMATIVLSVLLRDAV
ncbi:hypothetical protein B0H17DRAFT_1197252 [Mycena rosella]|uniref:Uncharacterized protein n=1 Tax=Mycena rosella TaxID=1033263 RepID=A0AAD7DRM5_MYCRO|nr:hypothetical protein B0H17DRAFT_1197252 [Mycena rosella]